MLRTFIQASALLLTLFAGVMLVRGSFALSPKDIAELSSSKWGHNLEMVKNLSQQQADARIGVVLLVLSVALLMINLLWPLRIKDFAVNNIGVLLAIIFSILVFILALKTSNIISTNTQREVTKILEQKQQGK